MNKALSIKKALVIISVFALVAVTTLAQTTRFTLRSTDIASNSTI